MLVVAGYGVFFFAPMNMIPIAAAGVLLFVGQAFIQTLMLMFLADTIEYGQWKMGKRNDSITFSIQPLINKLGAAVATGVLTLSLAFLMYASRSASVGSGWFSFLLLWTSNCNGVLCVSAEISD